MFPNVADFPNTKMPVSASLTGLSAHLGYTSRYDSYFQIPVSSYGGGESISG